MGNWLVRCLVRDHEKHSGPVHQLRRQRIGSLRTADLARARNVAPRENTLSTPVDSSYVSVRPIVSQVNDDPWAHLLDLAAKAGKHPLRHLLTAAAGRDLRTAGDMAAV